MIRTRPRPYGSKPYGVHGKTRESTAVPTASPIGSSTTPTQSCPTSCVRTVLSSSAQPIADTLMNAPIPTIACPPSRRRPDCLTHQTRMKNKYLPWVPDASGTQGRNVLALEFEATTSLSSARMFLILHRWTTTRAGCVLSRSKRDARELRGHPFTVGFPVWRQW